MKTKEIFRLPILVIMGALLIFLFTSYGNKKVHPDLNSYMIDSFLKRCNVGEFSLKDFKKYSFYLEESGKIKGTAIVKDGLFSTNDAAAGGVVADLGIAVDEYVVAKVYSEEGPAEMTPRQWIIDGGYAADVPEVPASLRHFYDPTRAAGDRYLTDITNAKIMGAMQKYVLTNPHTDGVDWALGKPGDKANSPQDHQFTWERGKMLMKMALKETDKKKKEAYMAGAWRSLGETLHMIADHGCPPHVRNDAHPSPLWGNNNLFGNPDPYEEFMDIIRKNNPTEFAAFATGKPDESLKAQFKNFTNVRDIAHTLAVFTNTNFVTNETISGTDKYGNLQKQITHPEYQYTSPVLDKMSYNGEDYSYTSAQGIKQCTDHYYFAHMVPAYCAPYVDINCVKSQAIILVPNLVEAGANVIKLFIPKFTVVINSLDKGILKGKITHKTDDEYPDEIGYNGAVTLIITNSNNKIIDEESTEAIDGVFESKIKLSKGEKVNAKIAFGGIEVTSDDYEVSSTSDVFGIYEGRFSMQFNEANWAEAEYEQVVERINQEEQDPDAKANKIKNALGWSKAFVAAAISNMQRAITQSKDGPKARFEINKLQGMENYYETDGLKYTVMNMNNIAFIPNVLTPLKDNSNAGSSLTGTTTGFTAIILKDNTIYTVSGTFSGNTLSGSWNAKMKGKEIWSATYSTRKVHDIN